MRQYERTEQVTFNPYYEQSGKLARRSRRRPGPWRGQRHYSRFERRATERAAIVGDWIREAFADARRNQHRPPSWFDKEFQRELERSRKYYPRRYV